MAPVTTDANNVRSDLTPGNSNPTGDANYGAQMEIYESPTTNLPLQKKTQKRRKPTQNCRECVERKIKCDRGRPSCLSCLKRQTPCRYTSEANILAATKHHRTNSDNDQRFQPNTEVLSFGLLGSARSSSTQRTYPSPSSNDPLNNGRNSPVQTQDNPVPSQDMLSRHTENSRGRVTSLSMFGIGSRHPFHNYWTDSGGVPEVVGVLPNKDQADRLIDNYFESVDPVYPIVSEQDFRAEYDRFWTLPPDEQCNYNAAQLALQFVIYACGTRLVHAFTAEQRLNTSNFYLSASYQCLCIHSYLNCFSLSSVKTAILMCHFLISENNISDAWTFSGMTQRLAYGLELHRDPILISRDFTSIDKQDRCKIWLCCMFQDSSLSMFLALPPTTLHHDISPSYLKASDTHEERSSQSRNSLHDEASLVSDQGILPTNDSAYLRALWEYVSFLQSHICLPKALDKHICVDEAHKESLLNEYRQMYDAWPAPFNSYDSSRFEPTDNRLMRQVVAVSSSYFYVLTMLYMDKNHDAGVDWDVIRALGAAHQGMAAFFALHRLDPRQIDSWGAYNTRAFFQAMMIGTLLAAQPKSDGEADIRLMLAMSDFDRYVDILVHGHGTTEYGGIQARRITDLLEIRRKIVAV